jgi:hypothetical protein
MGSEKYTFARRDRLRDCLCLISAGTAGFWRVLGLRHPAILPPGGKMFPNHSKAT